MASERSMLAALVCTVWLMWASLGITADDPAREPLTPAERSLMKKSLDERIAAANAALKQQPDDLKWLSQRGDASFFLGKFDAAFADYDAMSNRDPDVAKTNWRRGLAAYYAGKYDVAAKQFETCFGEDKSDRENGIWRYFSQRKSVGPEQARQQLLKYEEADRSPLPLIYDRIAGRADNDQLLKAAEHPPVADRADHDRFYLSLYLGMFSALDGDDAAAQKHFAAALKNPWAREGGYGPRYMWQIALLEYDAAHVRLKKSPPRK